VRCDVDLEEEAGSRIATASKLATELDTQIELAGFLPGGAQLAPAMTRLRTAVEAIQPRLARVFVLSKGAEATTPEMAVQAVDELSLGSGIPVVVGTNANFNELNRNRPADGPASGLVWAVNPQVHASDELSLVENLAAQAETVETARSFAPTSTLHVSPVTLRPRFNAVATIGEEFKPQGLPWNVDPRQTSLFAAAWTLASGAVLSTAGVDSLTYCEMVGPRGLIESPQGSIYPEQFHSLPDTAYPLALVLSDLCSLRGAEVLSVDGFDPLKLAVLACVTPLGRTVLVANLTRGEVSVDVVGLGESCRRRVLDSSTVPAATAMPSEFLGSGSSVAGSAGTIALQLGPYACARLDA
jgi:hypothetical protein